MFRKKNNALYRLQKAEEHDIKNSLLASILIPLKNKNLGFFLYSSPSFPRLRASSKSRAACCKEISEY